MIYNTAAAKISLAAQEAESDKVVGNIQQQADDLLLQQQLNNLITQFNSTKPANPSIENNKIDTAQPLLVTLLNSKQLPAGMRRSLHEIKMFPPKKQSILINDILKNTISGLTQQIADKGLSSIQITQAKENLANLQAMSVALPKLVGTSSNINSAQMTESPSAITAGNNLSINYPQVNYPIQNFYNNQFPVNDFMGISNIGETALDSNFLSQCDLPTKVLFVMLWMAEGPITSNMDSITKQIVTNEQNSNIIGNSVNMFNNVVNFFQANASSNPHIDVFKAFNYWMYQNHPGELAPNSQPQVDNLTASFANNMGGTNGLFSSMYQDLIQINQQLPPGVTLSSSNLAGGDQGSFIPTSTISMNELSHYPQQIFMSYFTSQFNQAGASINGQASPPLFGSEWTQIDSLCQTNGLYHSTATSGAGAPYSLVFTTQNVEAFIGNSTTGPNSGLLAQEQQTTTTASQAKSNLLAEQTYFSNLFSNAINSGIGVLGDIKISWLN